MFFKIPSDPSLKRLDTAFVVSSDAKEKSKGAETLSEEIREVASVISPKFKKRQRARSYTSYHEMMMELRHQGESDRLGTLAESVIKSLSLVAGSGAPPSEKSPSREISKISSKEKLSFKTHASKMSCVKPPMFKGTALKAIKEEDEEEDDI